MCERNSNDTPDGDPVSVDDITYPLGVVMDDENPRTRIFETLLTTRRSLSFGEIVRRADVTPSEAAYALYDLRRFEAVWCPSYGLYRLRRGSPVGSKLHDLREVLHAEMYPDSWAAEEIEVDTGVEAGVTS